MRKLTMAELHRISAQTFKSMPKMPVVIVLDNIRSQHNVGSVFRTADAFRLQGIHLCGITATPPNREIHRTALGATESVAWEYFPATELSIQSLKQKGYQILALEQTDCSISLEKYTPPVNKSLALIFGNEVHGVDESMLALVDTSLEIPQFGTKHSFNVSVSVGIVIWDFMVKLKNFSM